jgi:hypothetical protein
LGLAIGDDPLVGISSPVNGVLSRVTQRAILPPAEGLGGRPSSKPALGLGLSLAA